MTYDEATRAANRAAQIRREDERIAALVLTAREQARYDELVAEGQDVRSWLLLLCQRRDDDAVREREYRDREESECPEAMEAHWRRTFAGMATDPKLQVSFPAAVGARGRRLAGWDIGGSDE